MSKLENGILFTDQYQLTMAQLYYKLGFHNTKVVFDHFFRSNPSYGEHKAGFCIYAGSKTFIDWLANVNFGKKEIEALASQKDNKGNRIFDDDFLKYLKNNWSLDEVEIRGFDEGRVVHPNEPITIVTAPLLIAQIIETALLNTINFQTLIATKASRVRYAARGNLLMEFGARRAHDKAANPGARAALIGGADFTSNVGISHKLNIQPKGTHAHSLIQFFIAAGYSEEDAFQAFADLYPDNCILLVDTIDTVESGLPNAIKVFERLKKKGHKPAGIRLDSGDLAELAVTSSEILDRNGFDKSSIVLSSDLDEFEIIKIHERIKEISGKRNSDAEKIINRLTYGVGTRLITSQGNPSLNGVYKLASAEKEGKSLPIIKLSDSKAKTNNPGEKDLYRIYRNDFAVRDIITLRNESPEESELHNKTGSDKEITYEPVLTHLFSNGKTQIDEKSIDEIREIRDNDLKRLPNQFKEIVDPEEYKVLLSGKLNSLKNDLIEELKKKKNRA